MPKAGGTTSPRRLSRVRQPPPPPSQTTSVSSTTSSTRQERSTRSHHKASSPQKSSTPQSLTSSEDAALLDESRTTEPHQLRRSKRTHEHEHDNDDEGDAKLEDAGDDDIVEDEETTRCLCGYQDYPGPPVDLSVARTSGKGSHPPNSEEEGGTDERGGLFIQCDGCLVWQHGGCVSVMDESAVPDKYYCEECKPELHELLKAPNGQKFSHYLPVWSKSHPKTARKGSVEKDDRSKQKDKERQSRASALPETKRRSTMNSRAAYDEDEVLRKVLEESKTEGQGSTDNGSRKGKRGRDESEDVRFDVKRQRTASSVLSSHSGDDSAGESETEKSSTIKRPLPRQASAPKTSSSGVKTESNSNNKTPTTGTSAAGQQAEAAVAKRRGGRRGGGGSEVVGEQRDSSSNGATWTCHCGLWTCLCGPSLIRDATGDTSNTANSSATTNNASSKDDAGEDESVPPSGRPSAKASPVRDADTPDTPTLAATQAGGKRGGKKTTALSGRGRSNPAPTPSERDDKDSPRNGTTDAGGDSTPIPAVTINGSTTSKRGKRGQHQAHLKDDSGESDRDHINGNGNATTAAHSDAEPLSTDLHTNTHHHGAAHAGVSAPRKKEPSMNELKRRAAAMLDWIERAQVDLGRASLVHLSLSPSSGSLSPPTATGGAVGGSGGQGGELGSVAEVLHSRLLGWQVEYGAG